MAWTIEFSDTAERQLKRLDVAVARRIRSFLLERVATADDPRGLGLALKGAEFAGYCRFRVGDYRLICDVQGQRLVVVVVQLGHRREVYD